MSGDRSYASVPERITWTTGFTWATDKLVLGALSTFANFETGKGARVRVKKLAARAELQPRTVQRALHRLEAEGWIVAVRRQHKGATSWDIVIERLAPTWVAMKAVGGVTHGFPQGDKKLNVTDVVQLNVTDVAQLNVTAVVQAPRLNVTDVVQEPILNVTDVVQLNVTDVAQIPCTERSPVQERSGSPVEPNPSAPALRAGWFENPDDPNHEDLDAPTHAPPAVADLRANRGPDSDDAGGGPRGPGSDQAQTPGVGVQLPERSDLPRAESVNRPRAPVRPTQPGLGLLADVNAPIGVTPSEDQHRRFMADLRSRVGLPTAADEEEKTG